MKSVIEDTYDINFDSSYWEGYESPFLTGTVLGFGIAVMGLYFANFIVVLIFLKCGCWEVKGCYNITQLIFGAVMFGLIVALIVLTSINFSKINQLSNATKAFLDAGINTCTDEYTQIPTD